MNGGDVIGKGTYGLVHHKDAIMCRNKGDYHKGIVSKLMTAKAAFQEYSETESISQTAKEILGTVANKYFVFPIDEPCEIDSNRIKKTDNYLVIKNNIINQESVDRIMRNVIETPYNYRLLHMQYGGKDVSIYTKQIFKEGNMEKMDSLKDGILDAFEYGILPLNGKGIYHKDLKLDNIVIDDTGAVRIIDWGLGLDMNKRKSSIPGYVQWNAPLSAPMIVKNDDYCDSKLKRKALFENLINDKTGHYLFVIDIIKTALNQLKKGRVSELLLNYNDSIYEKYTSQSDKNKIIVDREKFSEEYHRGVDIWGIVMIFGKLLIDHPHIIDEAKSQISNAVLELFTDMSLEMKEEQAQKILQILRQIQFNPIKTPKLNSIKKRGFSEMYTPLNKRYTRHVGKNEKKRKMKSGYCRRTKKVSKIKKTKNRRKIYKEN